MPMIWRKKALGDTIFANVLLLGYAWQRGLVPLSEHALLRAIELNGVAVERNKLAFTWGRFAAAEPDRLASMLETPSPDADLESLLRRREEFLTGYQNAKLAARYRGLVERVEQAERSLGDSDDLATAVAHIYFKVLSYKDEYEVARLHTQRDFLESVRREFGNSATLRYHLAPPIMGGKKDARGRPQKREFGPWMLPLFRVLARLRFLRGTPLDVFGMTAERRMERALISEFEAQVDTFLQGPDAQSAERLRDVCRWYGDIRGFGPVKDAAVERVRAKLAQRAA